MVELRTVDGIEVEVLENGGKPLLITQRMAALGMRVWDKVWPYLADDFTLAALNLPVPATDEFDDPAAMFDRLAGRVVGVAAGLGHERFHFLGSTSGSRVGLHVLTRHQDALLSCVIYDPVYAGAERRPFDRLEDLWEVLLRAGSLETYTWWWMLRSFTPRYAEEHYDELAGFVERRLIADRPRGLDAERVLRWNRALSAQTVSDGELDAVRVPTLVVGAAGSAHLARRLAARIPTAQLANVPLGGFGMHEDPTAWLAPIRPFLTARRSAVPPQLVSPADAAVSGTRVRTAEPPSTGIVLLHGWLMSPAMWDAQLDALARAGVRAVALAQPGHAGSDGPPLGFTMDAWVDRTIATVDRLGLERFVVVGHSMGGMLALAIAERFPERVAGVGLVSTTDEAWDAGEQDQFVAACNAVAAAWGPELAEQVGNLLLGEDFLRQTAGFVGTWRDEVASYDLDGMIEVGKAVATRPDQRSVTEGLLTRGIPVTVIHGDDDDAVDLAEGQRMAKRAGVECVVIPGAGHCPPIEAPAETAAAIVELARRSLRGG